MSSSSCTSFLNFVLIKTNTMWTKNNIPDQTNKTILITGANTGIGYETALAFYEAGAHVILACRDREKTEIAIEKLKLVKSKGSLELGILDLSDLNSLAGFSEKILSKHKKLDVLINNAGVMTAGAMSPEIIKTKQGYEMQFGVNFLGHFALTGLLYPLLKSTEGSRIITLSSMAYLRGVIDFENLKSEKSHDSMREYAQSKLADMLLSIELDRRIKKKGDTVLSLAAQPGANQTELIRHMSEEEITAGIARVGELMHPSMGALPSILAAVSSDAKGGEFYEPSEGYRGYPVQASIKENAMDKDVAKKLWELAEQVTGVKFP